MFGFNFNKKANNPPNPPIDPDKMSRKQKESAAREIFNQQTATEILALIEAEEKPAGTPRRKAISIERKNEITREHFNKRRAEFDAQLKETLDGDTRKALEKTMDWWDGLDESKGGKALKIGISTTVVVGGTIGAGAALGISPGPLGAARKILTRVGLSVAANMMMTSNIPGRIKELFNGDPAHSTPGHTPDEGWLKKNYKKLLVGGTVVTIYIMSGPLMAAVSGAGIALKEATKRIYDHYIKKQKELSEKKLELVKNGFTIEEAAFEVNKRTRNPIDIKVLIGKLDEMNKEYDAFAKAAASVKTLERLKEVTNMAETMAAGLGSMEIHATELDKVTTSDLMHGRLEHQPPLGEAKAEGGESGNVKAEGELKEKNTDNNTNTQDNSSQDALAKARADLEEAKKELEEANKGEDKSILEKAEEKLKNAKNAVENLAEKAKNSIDKTVESLTQDEIRNMTHADNTVEVSSRGAVATLNELKEKIKLQYKDLDKAPEEIQEFVKGKSIEQAKELGFYKPDEVAESANILKGSTLSINEKGELVLHDARDGKFIVIDEDHPYGGKFGDYMHERVAVGGGRTGGYDAPEFVGNMQDNGYTEHDFKDLGEEVDLYADVPDFKEYITNYIRGDYTGTPMAELGDTYRELLNSDKDNDLPSLDELKGMTTAEVYKSMKNIENNTAFGAEPGDQQFDYEIEEAPERIEVDAARVPLSKNPYELSEEQLRSANSLYAKLIDQLPEKTEEIWNESLKNSNATILIHGQDVANNAPELAGPVAAIKFLYNVTGLEPAQQTDVLNPAETNEHYVQRAIHYAFKNGLSIEGLERAGFREIEK